MTDSVTPPQTAPYGSWRSPITSDLIVTSSIGLGEIMLDGTEVYWLEARPQEGGRLVLVRRSADGAMADVTPPISPDAKSTFSVRTRVHEYGGGAYVVDDGVVYFANDGDRRLYRQAIGAEPVPITADAKLRFADGIIDRARSRMIWVCEDHTESDLQPTNSLVEVSLDGSSLHRVLVSGNDFYSSPKLSPDCSRLAWLEWHHPNMPWMGTELWVGHVAADGSIGQKWKVAGGDEESIFQPEWSPNGRLYFVSDRSGWWNLYRLTDDARAGNSQAEPLYPLDAEFGQPQWVFRMSTYAFESERRLICSYTRNGSWSLAAVDLATLRVEQIKTEFTDISSVRAAPGRVYFRGGAPTRPLAIVELELASGKATTLRISSSQDVEQHRGYISVPQAIEYPTEGGLTAHALFYPPANKDFTAPAGELPPLIVHSHGGPTSAASSTLDWKVQYWTSRGFGILDVNYGGSTGYGRAYRQRLQGQWGIVDVHDCVNGARFLADEGRVDPKRLAISGGSAGGYTTLCALTFHDTFKTGASYYGVSDLEALAKDTHKFESRYLDGLIGPYPERRDLYQERSPIYFVGRLAVPIAFFQGAEDAIVPPSQAEAMVQALKAKALPFVYLLFDGEQHGFRRSQNIKRALDAELYFYSIFLSGEKLMFPA
ncbi:MAG TPA: S9 family peptidase [Terriglobia bacterium]|nr:S9 family peptidase [Terriglobia bacterium]